jgi:hypothetical protein
MIQFIGDSLVTRVCVTSRLAQSMDLTFPLFMDDE